MKKLNRIFLFYTCSLCMLLPIKAQFYEDFNDINKLITPKWTGDVHHFVINEAQQLQLNALLAGESSIFTKFNLPSDSIQVEFYLKMTFDPSDNNFTKIFLWTDDLPVNAKNGYFLRLGENGTQDQIKFYKIKEGQSHLLGAGKIAGIARDPVIVRIRLSVQQHGSWRIETDYTGNQYFREEISFQDPQPYLPDSGIFCIQMKYTTSRLDAFYVDDIKISKPDHDSVAPQLLKTNVLDSMSLQLVFSEILRKKEACEISNYHLQQQNEFPDSVYFDDEYPFQLKLKFEQPFDGSIIQVLECNNISDLKGNSGFLTTSFIYAQKPGPGHIVINEILTDPFEEGGDFIELHNTSSRFLDLSSVYLCNISKEESVLLPENTILPPQQFLAICEDTLLLKETYTVPEDARFCQTKLPGLNISDAFVGISNFVNQKIFIDSVFYKKSWHHPLLLNTRGISIERINPSGPSNNSLNWHSASKTTGFATPGYINSVFQDSTQQQNQSLWLSSKSFIPVSDENLDILKINYSMEKSGYLATVFVFDSDGGPVCTPVKNELMGSEGFLRWDGLNEDIQPVPTGLYVLLVNCFHADGDQFSARFSVAVIR